jgi:hypothetical protein
MPACHRRSTRNMLAAEPAKPSVSMMVMLTCGPASSVTGASSTAGSRIEVFHIRLMPRGAFNAVVTSDGSLPCETAVAA